MRVFRHTYLILSLLAVVLLTAPAVLSAETLYLHGTPQQLSLTSPAGSQNGVIIDSGYSSDWQLAPALQSPVTVSGANIPVTLWLTKNDKNKDRLIEVQLYCSSAPLTYSTSGNVALDPDDITAAPYTFNLTGNLPMSCGTGDHWVLRVFNRTLQGKREITVHHPVSGAIYSQVDLPVLPQPPPSITLVKMVHAHSDPINGTTNPYAIPGAHMLYTIIVTNFGGAADIDSVVISDPVPANTDLVVTGDPVTFANGATMSGLSFDPDNDVVYSDAVDIQRDPVTDANGVDPAIRKIVINPKGTFLPSNGPPHPSFSLSFKVRVR